MSLHGKQQGVKSAESDPGGIQSPLGGKKSTLLSRLLQHGRLNRINARIPRPLTNTIAALKNHLEHSRKEGGGASRTPPGGWCGAASIPAIWPPPVP